MNAEAAPESAATTDPAKVYQQGSDLLAEALNYAAHGWPVFPITPGGKTPVIPSAHKDKAEQRKCKGRCGRQGHGLYDATTEPAVIRAWWRKWPDANIGHPTGGGSGHVVLDPDGPEGEATLNRLAADLGAIPETFTVRTPGGRHVYVEHPGGTVKNSTSKLGPDLDVRGDGGYVVLPPSRRPDGVYVVERDTPIQALRPAWHDRLRGGKAPEPVKVEQREQANMPFDDPAQSFTREQAETMVAAKLDELRGAPNGTRNDTLYGAADLLGHFVPVIWSEDKAVEMLTEAAEDAGLENGEISATIASGLGRGMAEPYTVEDEEPRKSRRVNLRPYLDGTYVPPVPSVGAERDDGVRLLYPGRWHSVIALTAAGKSWFAIWHAKAVLDAGGTVVYLHFEETSPALTLGRLRALGVADDVIAERFVWLDCDTRWTREQFEAELDALDQSPTLVVVDGVNAMCTLHGWPVNEPGAVGAYRLTFEKPATKVDAAVLSLGHPPKAPDRQSERHGYGATGWLDEVDGVGFRLVASNHPIRRGHRGGSQLYSVKDRDDQVQRHGQQVRNRDGWWYLGLFVLDDTGLTVVDGAELRRVTVASLTAPEVDDSGQEPDPIGALAREIVKYLAGHGRRFESQARLKDALRAARVKHDDNDLGPALLQLVDDGELEWPETGRGKARPGWLKESTEVRDR
jgi:hypothetical protein